MGAAAATVGPSVSRSSGSPAPLSAAPGSRQEKRGRARTARSPRPRAGGLCCQPVSFVLPIGALDGVGGLYYKVSGEGQGQEGQGGPQPSWPPPARSPPTTPRSVPPVVP